MAKTINETSDAEHVLDLGIVDALDEINGDEQLARVWCRTCRRFEYHSVDRNDLQDGAVVRTTGKPWA